MFHNTLRTSPKIRATVPLVALTALLVGSANVGRAQVFQPLGDLPGGQFFSRANGVSADGSVVVGVSFNGGVQAFIWDATHGMRGLSDILGFQLACVANAVSADGSVVVGEAGQAFRWDADPGKLMINWGATLLDEPDRPFLDGGIPIQTEALWVEAVEGGDDTTVIRR